MSKHKLYVCVYELIPSLFQSPNPNHPILDDGSSPPSAPPILPVVAHVLPTPIILVHLHNDVFFLLWCYSFKPG
jgi:hypothetical protein